VFDPIAKQSPVQEKVVVRGEDLAPFEEAPKERGAGLALFFRDLEDVFGVQLTNGT